MARVLPRAQGSSHSTSEPPRRGLCLRFMTNTPGPQKEQQSPGVHVVEPFPIPWLTQSPSCTRVWAQGTS